MPRIETIETCTDRTQLIVIQEIIQEVKKILKAEVSTQLSTIKLQQLQLLNDQIILSIKVLMVIFFIFINISPLEYLIIFK